MGRLSGVAFHEKLLLSVALGCLLSQSAQAALHFGFTSAVRGHQVTGTFDGIMNGSGTIAGISNYQVAIDGLSFQGDSQPNPISGYLYDPHTSWTSITTLNLNQAYGNIAFTDSSNPNPFLADQTFAVIDVPSGSYVVAQNGYTDDQYYSDFEDRDAAAIHLQLLGGTQQFAFTDQIEGQLISGTFTAAFDGHLVTDFTDISVSVNGIAQTANPDFTQWGYVPGQGFVQGAGVATLDGSVDNFIFSGSQDDYWESGTLSYRHTPFGNFLNGPGIAAGAQPGVGNFRLSVVGLPEATAAAVPEPASWAMLLGGFGLVGATMRGRRRIAAALA